MNTITLEDGIIKVETTVYNTDVTITGSSIGEIKKQLAEMHRAIREESQEKYEKFFLSLKQYENLFEMQKSNKVHQSIVLHQK